MPHLPRPIPPKPVEHWEGVADPAYLQAEITELRDIAEKAGLGTIAYLLECARLEAKEQVRQKAERDGSPETGSGTCN